MNVKPGDKISVNWDGANPGTFIVYAVIDYWPSWNPNPGGTVKEKDKDKVKDEDEKELKPETPMLVVGNLSYIQANMGLEPYQVWLKLLPNATSQQIYDALAENNITINQYTDGKQEIIRSKSDPFRLAINGVMTLGFVVSILICFFGFLLYWILTLSGRVLQFGIFRAMGMSLSEVIGMLFTEQLLTSGAAIMIGVLTGLLTSHLFVSLFQISFNPTTLALPFQVIVDTSDQVNLFIIVTLMITLALIILGLLLSRIRIHQAIKLGED
jgi:putative ABC transport system permease protein